MFGNLLSMISQYAAYSDKALREMNGNVLILFMIIMLISSELFCSKVSDSEKEIER